MNRPGAHTTHLALAVVIATCALAGSAAAQQSASGSGDLVNLDFNDVELTVVIDTIAKLTGKNFIYDDRVRGRVTILSPGKVTVDQAYAVFESVLKVKGFTAVPGPANVLKIIPIRDAKESNIETIKDGRASANRDIFVTRLIPLLYIDATEITNTIKPLVSKDASIIAYAPTNMIILTDTASNIRRLLSILESIDVKTHKEELAIIKIRHADAQTLGDQISQIYGADVTRAGSTPSRRTSTRRSSSSKAAAKPVTGGGTRSSVRIFTDERTNSLLVLAAQAQIQDVRDLVRQLDVPVIGGGRIHVYYLKHSDAEELSQTLNGLLSGQPRAPSGGSPGRTGAAGGASQTQALRSQITEFASGITVTADPATNSLVIQASKEAYETLVEVIEQLDIPRPQVLVEALIMEVDITENMEIGVDATIRVAQGDSDFIFNLGGSAAAAFAEGAAPGLMSLGKILAEGEDGTAINAIITATANDNRFNVISAPHILTSDNEEAELRIGDNIPIVTSRVASAAGQQVGLSTSQNIERQDIGVALRVTPQISEGDTLRLKIYQEITQVNEELTDTTGSATESGVALRKRTIENTVVVNNGETVVVGGLISEANETSVTKVPFFGDIPFLGFAFRKDKDGVRKVNLLVFLTPHIIRSNDDLIAETIRKRREMIMKTTDENDDVIQELTENPQTQVHRQLRDHAQQYPLERLEEIEQARSDAEAERRAALDSGVRAREFEIVADVFSDDKDASRELTRLIDAGFDAAILSGTTGGVLVFELRVGPYASADQAEKVADVLREVYGHSPYVTMLERPAGSRPPNDLEPHSP